MPATYMVRTRIFEDTFDILMSPVISPGGWNLSTGIVSRSLRSKPNKSCCILRINDAYKYGLHHRFRAALLQHKSKENVHVKQHRTIIIIIIISFMQGIYTYIPETNHVPREYSVSAILSLIFMVSISLVPALWHYCTFTSALFEVCVQCPI